MAKYAELGTQIGQLVDEKQAAYGDSFSKCGEFLKLLYPGGISPDKYVDALCLVRIFDKLMRIATDKDALGESPYRDIAGYGLLGAMVHTAVIDELVGREHAASMITGAQSTGRGSQEHPKSGLFCLRCGKQGNGVREVYNGKQPMFGPDYLCLICEPEPLLCMGCGVKSPDVTNKEIDGFTYQRCAKCMSKKVTEKAPKQKSYKCMSPHCNHSGPDVRMVGVPGKDFRDFRCEKCVPSEAAAPDPAISYHCEAPGCKHMGPDVRLIAIPGKGYEAFRCPTCAEGEGPPPATELGAIEHLVCFTCSHQGPDVRRVVRQRGLHFITRCVKCLPLQPEEIEAAEEPTEAEDNPEEPAEGEKLLKCAICKVRSADVIIKQVNGFMRRRCPEHMPIERS